MKQPNQIIKDIKRIDLTDHFPPIKLGKFLLSVQGSSFHCCFPKNDFFDLDLYSSYEIALFEEKGANSNWVKPFVDKRFKKFKWAVLFKKVKSNLPIASFVDKEIIKEIIKDITTVAVKSMD